MQSIFEIIKQAKKTENTQLLWSLWKELGSCKKDSNSSLYAQDSFFYVEELGDLIYCAATYTEKVNWSDISEVDLMGTTALKDGVTVEVFNVALEDVDIPDEIEPLDLSSLEAPDVEVNISNKELMKLLTYLGAPLITPDQLELHRDEIINYYISPCVDVFYTYFPIVEESTYNVGADFDIEFPENAYNAIMMITGGTGGATAGSMSPFAYAGNLMVGGMLNGGMGGRFGRGLYYNKRVPGFTGSGGNYYERMSEMMKNAQIMQTYKNVFRRVHFQKKLVGDKWHATGYSMNGGKLNVRWLEKNPNWDAIPTDMLTTMRPYTQGYILENIGFLRDIVKDSELPTNAEQLKSKGAEMMKSVLEKWNKVNSKYTVSRGATTF